MKVKCTDCGLEFEVNIHTGKYTLNKTEQLCCPICQANVDKNDT